MPIPSTIGEDMTTALPLLTFKTASIPHPAGINIHPMYCWGIHFLKSRKEIPQTIAAGVMERVKPRMYTPDWIGDASFTAWK
jgi:hypothetical protein